MLAEPTHLAHVLLVGDRMGPLSLPGSDAAILSKYPPNRRVVPVK